MDYSFSQHIGLNDLSEVRKLSFKPTEKKILPGNSQETAPNESVLAEDVIGNLAVVSLYYQNACYTDGKYNNNNYPIEKGVISDGSSEIQWEAYKVFGPTHKATQFLASQHNIYFMFTAKVDYAVYIFENSVLKKVAEVKAADVKVGGFTKINGQTISNLKSDITYVFLPSKTNVNGTTQLASNLDGLKLNETILGDVYQVNYTVPGNPFDNQTNSNSDNRHFFGFPIQGGKTGVIWQDMVNMSLYLSIIESDVKKFQTVELPNPNRGFLAAATGNEKGEAYYVTIFETNAKPVDMMVSKYSTMTKSFLKTSVDVSKSGANFFSYQQEVASLQFSKDRLLLMIARRTHKSSDGLNHQGGIALLFETGNMSLLKNYGQTSGHSFDNVITANSKGEFIGMDLGDNYPRGIHMHAFGDYMQSALVYTFKTQHGTSANCYGIKNYPYYPEISTSSNKFYKWSNDNMTYTELGGILEATDGYLVSFLGEPDKYGKSLNCSLAGKDCSRNVGFVKVKTKFYETSSNIFLSSGISESGGFYDFGGSWTEQRNTGVVWLTAYQNPQEGTAKYLKSVKLNDESFLFLWEFWINDTYRNTLALRTDQNGKPINSTIDLGTSVRLDRRNEMVVKGNQLLIFSGNSVDKKLTVTFIELQ
jgi:hypothetical protein